MESLGKFPLLLRLAPLLEKSSLLDCSSVLELGYLSRSLTKTQTLQTTEVAVRQAGWPVQ